MPRADRASTQQVGREWFGSEHALIGATVASLPERIERSRLMPIAHSLFHLNRMVTNQNERTNRGAVCCVL